MTAQISAAPTSVTMPDVVVCPLHWYHDPVRLEAIRARMRDRGAPVLRGFLDRDAILLREGTHRIRAALELGMEPTIVLVPWWRSAQALVAARFAAARRGLLFPQVRCAAAPERS